MAAFLLGSATAARAAIVSQYVSGTVGGQYTTDTYGLFGPFAPAKAATLQFTNFYQYYFALGVDAPFQKEGAQVSLYYASAVGFGATLSPVNNPVNFNPPPNSNPLPNNVAISVSGGTERISFTIIKASR